MLECVPNVSEGRDAALIERLATSCGRSLIDQHHDSDHNRSVFTLAGPGERDAETSVRMLARCVADTIDIRSHSGEHPRLGALDVVPFIALGTSDDDRQHAVDAAHSFARWWSTAYQVPCFVYDAASESGMSLPTIRRRAFQQIAPDYGPSIPHRTLGATAIGARKPLIAVNCVLVSNDLRVANRIAYAVRETSGGLPGVRALAFRIERGSRVQVSMNLFDLDKTGLETAVLRVRDLATELAVNVGSVELVGLMPSAEFKRCSPDFLEWAALHRSDTIEARVTDLYGGTFLD